MRMGWKLLARKTHRLGPLCARHQLSSHQHPLLRQAAGDDSNESLDVCCWHSSWGLEVNGSWRFLLFASFCHWSNQIADPSFISDKATCFKIQEDMIFVYICCPIASDMISPLMLLGWSCAMKRAVRALASGFSPTSAGHMVLTLGYHSMICLKKFASPRPSPVLRLENCIACRSSLQPADEAVLFCLARVAFPPLQRFDAQMDTLKSHRWTMVEWHQCMCQMAVQWSHHPYSWDWHGYAAAGDCVFRCCSRSRDRKARRHATHQAQNHCLRLNYSRSFLTAINCCRFRSFRDGVLSELFSVHKCFVHKSHVLAEVLRVIMSIMEIPHVNVWWLTELFTNASLWIFLQLGIYSFRTYSLVMYHYIMLQRFFVVIGCSSFSGPQGRRVKLLCQTGWRWRQEDRKAGSLHLFLSSLDFAVPHSIV